MNKNSILTKLNDPNFTKKFHGWATVFWIAMAFPSMLLWSASIPYLVGLSVYAVVTGHWAAYQAVSVELNQKEDANVQEVLDILERMESANQIS